MSGMASTDILCCFQNIKLQVIQLHFIFRIAVDYAGVTSEVHPFSFLLRFEFSILCAFY